MLGAVVFGQKQLPASDRCHRQARRDAPLRSHGISSPRTSPSSLATKVRPPKPSLRDAYAIPAKHERRDRVAASQGKVMAALVPADDDGKGAAKAAWPPSKRRRRTWCAATILETEQRIDGRDLKTVRPIVCEVGILPRTHGSALFTRGETQALVVATLGTGEDEQYVDALQGTYKETFLLHYNFPPYSVGETGRMALARTPRDRPRQARLARHPPGAAGARAVPLHHPRRVGDHRVERLLLDGHGVRLVAGDDGRGHSAEATGCRHRHGPDQGGRALRRAVRHSRRRGPSRRHGLQGGRHRARA